ncbi:MAG TPA: hypothetical protein VHQ90_26535 [Thermoanaerobaculia bacterium]|nr:hypothetical protein [Thermoanaerobaculia bacterium]
MADEKLYSECIRGSGEIILSLRQLNQDTFCLEVGRLDKSLSFQHAQIVVEQTNLFLLGGLIHRYGLSTIPPEKRLAKDESDTDMPRDSAE